MSPPESEIERLLRGLLAPIELDTLRALIQARQGLIALLPDEERGRIAEVVRGQRWQLNLLTVGRAGTELRRMRPDLAPALDVGGGREWLGRELRELRGLASRRAV